MRRRFANDRNQSGERQGSRVSSRAAATAHQSPADHPKMLSGAKKLVNFLHSPPGCCGRSVENHYILCHPVVFPIDHVKGWVLNSDGQKHGTAQR
jgi:hypothetical protein